ncbi:MAG: hypothetical protein ACRYGP_07870, partial [Janthinobacterium lividum]
ADHRIRSPEGPLMNEREIQADCLRQALASASPEPLIEAQRLYDLRAAELRVDSLRAQMTGHSVVHAGDGCGVNGERRTRPGQLLFGESRFRDKHGAPVDADRAEVIVWDERAHSSEVE